MKLKDNKKIQSLQTLQRIQDNYSIALGIPISIRDTNGIRLTKPSDISKLWHIMENTPGAEAQYLPSLQTAIEKCQRTGQSVVFERIPDSYAFLAPIHTGSQITAYFVGGLVRFGNPNLTIANEICESLDIDINTYLDAHLSLPFLTKERLEASANLIKIIGNTISSLENEENETKIKALAIQQRNFELSKNLETTSQTLSHHEDRFKHIFDTVNDGIYAADLKNGKIIEINKAGASILGDENPNNLKGQALKQFYTNPRDRQKFTQILKEKGSISQWIANITISTGEQKFLETNANLIIDKKTGQSIIHGIFREINTRQHRPIR